MKHKIAKQMKEKASAAQNTAVGSSSRPGAASKHPIESSAPGNHHHQGRHVKGALK